MAKQTAPMDRLRAAIIADVTEDLGMVGEMTEQHVELAAAFNAVVDVERGRGVNIKPITRADLEGAFDA